MTLFAWELQTLLKCRYSFETVLSLFYFKPISYFLGSLFTFNLIFIKWSNFLSGIREEKNNWMSILADQVGEGIEEGCIHEDRSADASWPFILLLGFSQMEWQILLAMSITTVTSTKFVLHILSFFFSKSSSEWFSWSSTINRYESNVGVSDFYGKKESYKSYDIHHMTINFFFLLVGTHCFEKRLSIT